MRLYRRTMPNGSISPYWTADITVCGERVRISTKRANKEEAKRVALSEMKRRQDAEQLGVKPEWTLSKLCEKYLATARSEGLSDVKKVEGRLRKLQGLPPFQGVAHIDPQTLIHKITPEMMRDIRDARLADGLANATVNHEQALFLRMVKAAREVWRVRVPDFSIKMLALPKKTRNLSADEEGRLLQELDPTREIRGIARFGLRFAGVQRKLDDQYDFTVAALDTGLRYSEITSLLKSQVLVTDDSVALRVWRSKVENYDTLAVPNRLAAVIRKRLAALPDHIDYLFPGFDVKGEWVNKPRAHATGGISKAVARANLNDPKLVKRYGRMTVHSLRHTFASKLVGGGSSLYEVQNILGHSSSKTTERYAHIAVSAASVRAAAILNSKA